MDELSIKKFGDPNASMLCQALEAAFARSLALEHGLGDFILSLDGMSGRKYRQLINNLIASLPDPRYLEIGSWAGSTACSAIFGNRLVAKCIDNWSEFGGPKETFFSNVRASIGSEVDFSFIESDF